MRPLDLTSIRNAVRSAPLAWVGALAVAALPAAALALKPAPSADAPAARPPAPPAPSAAHVGEESGAVSLSDLFGGSENPFLTEEQSRERRFRAALAKVEEVLRRRPDVRDVTVLASWPTEVKSAAGAAVVTVRMREGVVPVTLVDAVGTLVSAAVPGLKPGDVTVIDEATGIRAKAVALDETQSMDGRRALAAAAERPVPVPSKVVVTPAAQASVETAGGAWSVPWSSWVWAAAGAGAAVIMLAGWMALHRRRTLGHADVVPAAEDPIAGTLAMALHRCVAEQGTLVTTALVERLEQGASASEVAQLLLNLEPWAAERLLKGMPPEALAKVEEALRDPATDAPIASVRALAEAVLAVRAAA